VETPLKEPATYDNKLSKEDEMSTARGTWKNLERKTARILGGKRIICSGIDGSGDVEHPSLYVECKYRGPSGGLQNVFAWYSQAVVQCPGGKTPILVLKQKGAVGELVVMDLVKFAELWGK